MKIGQVMSQMHLLGYTGLENPDNAEAVAASYRSVGIIDGDGLAVAWERCQAVWKKVRCPKAAEFKQFMPEQKLIADRRFQEDFQKYLDRYAEVYEWAWKQIIGRYGNPNAIGPTYGGRQLSAWLADENNWLHRFDPSNKCACYVRLKLRHEEGFGGIEDVEIAKAALLPSPEDVEQVRPERMETC